MSYTLIVISGPPASGKTYLAKKLAEYLVWPVFRKDDFKELLYDQFEEIDLALTRKLGKISHLNLEFVSEALISKGVSHIIEANFDSRLFSPYLQGLKKRYNFNIIEVNLSCEGTVLLKRFIKREQDGKQHPGHQGLRFLEQIRPILLRGRLPLLAVESEKIQVDTTDFQNIDYNDLFKQIEIIINSTQYLTP